MAEARTTRGVGPGMVVAALGVVFGDLGTSPLYTFQTIVEAIGGGAGPGAALGVLSLIFWTLILTVTIKYCAFVMRADNDGEGGILALMAKVGGVGLSGSSAFLTACGLVGAALIYGDGAITPAISVLSALEGVNVATPALKAVVLPLAVAILIGLFVVQRFGTARIGAAFGPIMLLWFLVIAALGLRGVATAPEVLGALDPTWGARILATTPLKALAVLGGVFLCITGAEALYADMGHFGRGPIRIGWGGVVLPALLLCYAGQAALLLKTPHLTGNPFYRLAPGWGIYPLVALATVATIIASQAIVTGAFSMTRQAVQLGWLPSLRIRQTSATSYGQIYVPVVNWMMMVATVAIAVGFGSSDRLAGAYGTAVSTTMLLTTALLIVAMLRVWRWPWPVAAALGTVFLVVDLAFFSANLMKIADGGWAPLLLGGALFGVMAIWRWGVDRVRGDLYARSEAEESFLAGLGRIVRVPGVGVFLTRNDDRIPAAVLLHLRYAKSLFETTVIVSVQFLDTPRCPETERANLEDLGQGLLRVRLKFGFTEIPDVRAACSSLLKGRLPGDPAEVVFVSGRDVVVRRPRSNPLAAFATSVFSFLFRNSARVVERFNLPADQVIEVAREIEI